MRSWSRGIQQVTTRETNLAGHDLHVVRRQVHVYGAVPWHLRPHVLHLGLHGPVGSPLWGSGHCWGCCQGRVLKLLVCLCAGRVFPWRRGCRIGNVCQFWYWGWRWGWGLQGMGRVCQGRALPQVPPGEPQSLDMGWGRGLQGGGAESPGGELSRAFR